MGDKQKGSNDFERGRKDGHKDESWHYKHPWQSSAGGGPSKRSGSDEYNKGYDAGREKRRRGE
jgi:hypothetical protein